MANQRFRGAMLNAELTPADLAAEVGVDPKTVGRWLTEDRIPYPITRLRIARVLNQQETFLWPSLVGQDDPCSAGHEIEGVWPTRASISSDYWHQLFSRVAKQIDILVYSAEFLFETLDLSDVLEWCGERGVAIRILVGDPDCDAVQARAAELGEPWLADMCRISRTRLSEPARKSPRIQVRDHPTVLYASHFHFDNEALIAPHAFAAPEPCSPILRIGRGSERSLLPFYADAFNSVWSSAAKV